MVAIKNGKAVVILYDAIQKRDIQKQSPDTPKFQIIHPKIFVANYGLNKSDKPIEKLVLATQYILHARLIYS